MTRTIGLRHAPDALAGGLIREIAQRPGRRCGWRGSPAASGGPRRGRRGRPCGSPCRCRRERSAPRGSACGDLLASARCWSAGNGRTAIRPPSVRATTAAAAATRQRRGCFRAWERDDLASPGPTTRCDQLRRAVRLRQGAEAGLHSPASASSAAQAAQPSRCWRRRSALLRRQVAVEIGLEEVERIRTGKFVIRSHGAHPLSVVPAACAAPGGDGRGRWLPGCRASRRSPGAGAPAPRAG